MCIAERANLIQSGQPIDGGEREIAPERVAMPCDARSSPFVVIGSPGARMKALRADDTNSHCVVRGSVAFTGAFACVHGLYSINAGQTSRLSANAAFIPSMIVHRLCVLSPVPIVTVCEPTLTPLQPHALRCRAYHGIAHSTQPSIRGRHSPARYSDRTQIGTQSPSPLDG